jgi:hypothetical protein
MRRRYVAALAVFVPVVAVAIIHQFFPGTYQVLDGYMVVIALMFKSALLSFWAASKLKFLAFLKGLTFLQGLYLLIKRWFLDNIFARWLKRNITDHIAEGFRDLKTFYATLNLRTKLRNIFLPILIGGGTVAALHLTGNLDKILLFTELKVVIISLSKTVLLVFGKGFGFMLNSWITPILEVFALSYFFTWLEEKLGRDNWLIRGLNAVGGGFNRILFFFAGINRRYIDPVLNDRVSDGSKKVSSAIQDYIQKKKISYEYEQFERFERTLLQGHIDAYHHFEGMEKITDKRTLYQRINHQTRDNLDIVAFLSRNERGELLPEVVEDSYYHDVFMLEGFASSQSHGVRDHQEEHPDHTDFWVLNTSAYPLTLRSHSGIVPHTQIEPHAVMMVKTDRPVDYRDGDIYGEFNGRTETVVPIST